MNTFLETQPKNQIMSKLLVIGIVMVVSWVATMFVWGIVQERENRQIEATNETSEQWSRPQTIAGPVLTVPIERVRVDELGNRISDISTLTLLPKNLSHKSRIETELLKRGVYEIPVYTTTINTEGNFDLLELAQLPTNARVLWDQAAISVHVSDVKGIASMFDLRLNGKSFAMVPASEFSVLDSSGVHADVIIDPKVTDYQFSFDLPLKGSQELTFLPLGENTEVAISSAWPAPSFTGEFLPVERTVTDEGFEATWNIAAYAKNMPQSWTGTAPIDTETFKAKAFGVGLHQKVNFYTMIDRSTKYSMLFIGLTFLAFFMYEILAGLRIHPMQYLLVGIAIAVFYLLLLSFAEVIGFLPAYLAAAVATTVLISGYCYSVLKLRRRALTMVTLLSTLYGYLYILLQMEQYSLLFGSILLFVTLAIVMYLTRNIDWYTSSETKV